MNGIQNFSKRIRKRIQNSVKRLFTTKSQETEEESGQKSVGLLKPPGAGSTSGRSYDSLQSTSSGDQFANEKARAYQKQIIQNRSYKYESGSFPTKSGENLQIPVSSSQLSSTKSEDQKHASTTKKMSLKNSHDPSKQLLVCPNGRHMDMRRDDACVCIHVEELTHHQSKPMIFEWHKFKSAPTSIQCLKLEYPITCVQGGQGVVFWVFDEKNNRHFALKMKQRDNKSKSSWLIEQRESKVLREIQHNFIVNLFHVHESAEAMFMTMEYLDGGCLWSHIAKKGTLPESYTVYYSACIMDALRYLHQLNIVYRDLKAENIVLDALGRPKLIDFGMAKKISRSPRFSSDSEEETERYPATQYYFAAYLAPEIYTKPSSANTFIDSWGIGYVVSELLLGYGVFLSMPWENSETNKMKENWSFSCDSSFPISSQCHDFLGKMLLYHPSSRMSIENASHHPFFEQVQWSTLIYIRPPDLSIFRSRVKGSKSIQAVISSDSQLPCVFEFCDLQLPDPLLTPTSRNYCNLNAYDVTTPKDTPVNPNAPSIRLPIFVKKDYVQKQKYKNMSNNLKYDIYRAFCVNSTQIKKTTIDTLSNLRPNRGF